MLPTDSLWRNISRLIIEVTIKDTDEDNGSIKQIAAIQHKSCYTWLQ